MRPKKPSSRSFASFSSPGSQSLSCTTPCFTFAFFAALYRLTRLGERGGHGLFAVDVLARLDRLLDQLRPQLRGSGVEEHRVAFRGERRVQVRGPALHAVLAREFLDLRRVAADEQRVGHQARTVLQRDAALLPDLQDGADEVLVHAHAPGDAVHDDADSSLAHLPAASMNSKVTPSQSRRYTTFLPLFGPALIGTGAEIAFTW